MCVANGTQIGHSMSTQKRNGVYHSRLRIPSDIQPILKKREIVRSLKTGSSRTAKIRAKKWEFRAHYIFTAIRSAKVSQIVDDEQNGGYPHESPER